MQNDEAVDNRIKFMTTKQKRPRYYAYREFRVESPPPGIYFYLIRDLLLITKHVIIYKVQICNAPLRKSYYKA